MNRFLSAMLLTAFVLTNAVPFAWALPQGYSSEDGSVVFDANSEVNTLIISSSNENTVVNFDSFNIAANETVKFQGVNFLGRVTGSSSSDIFGSLFGPNGQLILVNPNGITFHEMANVQVGSLIASTLDIQSSLYLQNQLQFEKLQGSGLGEIINRADIAAAQGGHLALLAEKIQNEGALTASQGSVVLGVGEKQTISFDQNNLINLVVDRGVKTPTVEETGYLLENAGAISANGGKVILSLKTLDDIFTHLVNNSGIIEASTAVDHGDGKIELISNAGIQSLGTIKARSFFERGASFNLGGNYLVGRGSIDNLDGAVNLNTGNYTGITADNVDIIVNAAQVLTLTGDAEFNADDDGNGSGAFTMNAGSSIVGAGFNLTLQSAGNATLRSITGVGDLTIRKSGFAGATPTFTMNNAITATGNLQITGDNLTFTAGTNNLTVGGNFQLGDGVSTPTFNAPGDNDANTAPVETLLIGGGFSPVSGTFNHRNGIVEFNQAGTASYISGSFNPTFWDLKCIAAGETLSIGNGMVITVASPNTFTLANMTLQGSPAGSQYTVSGLSNSNTNWSNVTVDGLINPGAYFTPGGAGPVTYGANNSNFGPAIQAVQNAIPQAALQAVQDVNVPLLANSAAGFGGGGGGSATKRGGDTGTKGTASRDAKPISDTISNVYVSEGVVAFSKNLTQSGSDKASGGGGGGALKAFPLKGENLLYQGDVGMVDAYGRSKVKMRSLFVSSADGLKVIRGSVHTPLKELPMGEKPSDLVANKKGDTVYASFPAAGNVTPVETAEYETEDPISTGKGLSGSNASISLSKDQKKMYVTNTMEDTVKEIDMETQEVTKTFNTGSYPSQVIVADNGNLIISNTLDGTVSVMDAKTGKTINKLEAGNSPYGVALSEETKQLFVADATNNEVLVFDANSFNEKTRIKVGKNPYKLQVAGEFLFVTNRSDDTMSVVSVKDLKETGRVPVGKRPSGLAAVQDVDNTKVYVANELSGNLSLIKVDEKGNAELAESIATGIGPTSVVISSPEKPVRK